jgi:hypothetical protein
LGQKKKQGVDDVQMFIEDKYDVRNWDLMDPLQRLTKRIVTTQLAKSRFIASVQTWKTGLDVETKTLMERRAFDDAIKHIRDHRSSRRDENLELPKVHRNMHTVPRCRLNFVSPCQRLIFELGRSSTNCTAMPILLNRVQPFHSLIMASIARVSQATAKT